MDTLVSLTINAPLTVPDS